MLVVLCSFVVHVVAGFEPCPSFSLIGNTNSFNLRVKISSSDGLLLWTGGSHSAPSSDYLMLGVRGGFLEFRFNLGNGEGVLVYNLTRIDDSKWHRIRATRFVRFTMSYSAQGSNLATAIQQHVACSTHRCKF